MNPACQVELLCLSFQRIPFLTFSRNDQIDFLSCWCGPCKGLQQHIEAFLVGETAKCKNIRSGKDVETLVRKSRRVNSIVNNVALGRDRRLHSNSLIQ